MNIHPEASLLILGARYRESMKDLGRLGRISGVGSAPHCPRVLGGASDSRPFLAISPMPQILIRWKVLRPEGVGASYITDTVSFTHANRRSDSARGRLWRPECFPVKGLSVNLPQLAHLVDNGAKVTRREVR